MISVKQRDDDGDKVDTVANESTGELMQAPCGENTRSDPDSSAPQYPIPCSDTSHEEINNAEDKESLMDRNLKVGVMDNQKVGVFDRKCLDGSFTKKLHKFMIGSTWSNIPRNKQPSSEKAPPSTSCNIPTKGSPATQDNSEKQDTPKAEDRPARSSILPTTNSAATLVSSESENCPANEMQGSPALPTQNDPTNLVNNSVSDKEEDGPSGEDGGESSHVSADIHRATPCGEDYVPPALSDSKDTPDSVLHKEAIASKLNGTPVGESEMSSATTPESNVIQVDKGEPACDCDGPSGQSTDREVKMPPQCDKSDIICGQGKTLPTATCMSDTTTGACPVSNDSPINTKLMTDVSASLDADKANITSTESTKPSQPSVDVCEAVVPCVSAPLSSASDSCSVDTPAECLDESCNASKECSVSERERAAMVDSSDGGDSIPNPADTLCEQKATENATVDAHTRPESEECRPTADINGIVTDDTELTSQPEGDGQDTTLVSCDDHTNLSVFTEADGKAADDSGSFTSFTNAVSGVVANAESACCGEDLSDFMFDEKTSELSEAGCPPSGPHEDVKVHVGSPDTVPSPSKYKTKSSSMPSLLYVVLTIMHFICPALSQHEAINSTSSNRTEVNSMTVENSSESSPVTGHSTMLGVCCIVVIGFVLELVYMSLLARHHSIFRWYTIILGVVMRPCKNACKCIGCVIKCRGQQDEAVLPLTSATDIQSNATNSARCLVPPLNEAMPPHVIENENSSSSVDTLSSSAPESETSDGKHMHQSVESGYHSMTPAPRSHVALPSGKDGHVPNRKPLRLRLNLPKVSQSTKLDSVHVQESVVSSPPQPTGEKRRMDNSIKVECTEAENCDPGGELVSFGFRKKKPHTTTSRWGVEQEATQPDERSSEFAGLTQQHREQTIQVLPPVVTSNLEVPNSEPSPVQTVALPIDPNVQVLAFNAAVEEIEHEAPDPPKDVPNIIPVTLESSFVDPEQDLQPHVGLAGVEVEMFQLQAWASLYTTPHPAQRDTANSAPMYPPLPGVPFANAELQPVFPPLPELPSTTTPMVVMPVAHVL